MNNVIQRADLKPYGFTYKIVPETTDTEMNVQTCFGEEGTAHYPVTSIQTILPATSNYKVRTCLTYCSFRIADVSCTELS